MAKNISRVACLVLGTLVIACSGAQKPIPAESQDPAVRLSQEIETRSANVATITGTVSDAAGNFLPGANILIQQLNLGAATDKNGRYTLTVPVDSTREERVKIECQFIGYEPVTETVTLSPGSLTQNFSLQQRSAIMDEITIRSEARELAPTEVSQSVPASARLRKSTVQSYHVSGALSSEMGFTPARPDVTLPPIQHNTEEYSKIDDNQFLSPLVNPLSTFSIDVDAASYANARRFLNQGQLPLKDAVRIEEFINYFTYEYEDPQGEHPFSVNTEVSKAPWNPSHMLVHIGLQGKKLEYDEIKPSNLVFLIDVSGSMRSQNKLPLLKSAFKLLAKNLGENDRIALVTYAGAAGLVLPSTPAKNTAEILKALDDLEAGGSTAGGAGIQLAYKVAKQNFIPDGNNRVILATDGDFNVGVSSTSELVRLIEEKRQDGIFLTICGFGMGNYKDGRMESISNAGNGNYYYIDTIMEANKVFGRDMRATLFTIAKDVKIQIEFNPSKVEAYRLIGYENRMLQSEDFNDDKKDAGELGAGHTVTALYEIIPAGVNNEFIKNVDELKYQKQQATDQAISDELMTVKLRYKRPEEETSRLLSTVIKDEAMELTSSSDNFRFSAAVAEFGMLLRDSEFKGDSSYDEVLELAKSAAAEDQSGYRAEFMQLVRKAQVIASATN